MNTPGHDELCVCDACRRHEFYEQCRSQLCALCLRPRAHLYHQPIDTPPPVRKPWASKLGSIRGSKS
jgi:hypothetical protein